ncbi:hypothetical protein [uncultured Allofournierella sp.]
MSKQPSHQPSWKELMRQHLTPSYLIGFLLVILLIFAAGLVSWQTFL